MATHPAVGLYFLFAICKKIALPFPFITGDMLYLITINKSYRLSFLYSFSALCLEGKLISLLPLN